MGQGRYFLATFGCRVNQADTQALMASLEAESLCRADSHQDADVVVINSCTVTHRSDTDVRKLVHRIQRENPAAKIVVTGCYAERDPQALAALPGLAAIVGNAHKEELAGLVQRVLAAPRDQAPVLVHTALDGRDPAELPPVSPVAYVADRTRPFVKIQDGCDAACTYCVIPEVRGRARSADPARVLEVLESLIRQGYFEIVLAGVHLGTYGERFGTDLAALVERALALPGLGRLRLSCIEPMAFPRRLIDLAAADPRLAPHFHLPLQAGADRTLKRMGRPYRAQDYGEIIDEIRRRLPNACLGTDLIVGFPGESEEEFAESCRFVQGVGLNYVHVFSYSDRAGVPSTRLPDKVDPRRVKERSTALHELARELWTRYLDAQVGQVLPAVSLERDLRRPEQISALSGNYCPVLLQDPHLEPNQGVRLRILGRAGDSLLGSKEEDRPPAALPPALRQELPA